MTRFAKQILVSILAAGLCASAADLNEEMFAAVRKGDAAAVKALLDKGADVNARGLYDQTPLFFAADRGHIEIVKLLLARGADVNRKDTFYNFTAIGRAAMKDHKDIVKLLAEAGATGLGQLAAQCVFGDDKELLKVLVDTGKLTPKELTSTLKLAQSNKKTEMAELLKAAGAKPPASAITLDAAVLQTYAGTYQGGRGGTEFEIVIKLEDGKLKGRFGQEAATLEPTSRTEFRSIEKSTDTIEFKVQDGKVTGFVLDPGGRAFTRKP